VVEQVAPADDKRVVVYASGADGGWGVLLTHGASRRELSGAERGAPRDRMSLLAVVSAVECLTRPTSVLVLTDSEYVRAGVAARTQGAVADERDADLWTRLGTAVTRHRVQWVVVDAALASRAAALAATPAGARPGAPDAPPAGAPATTPAATPGRQPAASAGATPGRESASARPPAAPAANSTPRAAAPRQGSPVAAVGPSVQQPAAGDGGPVRETSAAPRAAAPQQPAAGDGAPVRQTSAAPGAAAPQQPAAGDGAPVRETSAAPRAAAAPAGGAAPVGGAPRGLPAEIAAAMRPASTLGRPSGERASLPFRAGDPVPAPPAPTPAAPAATGAPATGASVPQPSATGVPADAPGSDADDLADDLGEDEPEDGVDEFLEELRFWLEDEARPADGAVDEWLRDTVLRVVDVTEESITFDDPAGRTIGPIPVPAGIAEQAEPGWRVTLTAARTGDAWHLRPSD